MAPPLRARSGLPDGGVPAALDRQRRQPQAAAEIGLILSLQLSPAHAGTPPLRAAAGPPDRREPAVVDLQRGYAQPLVEIGLVLRL